MICILGDSTVHSVGQHTSGRSVQVLWPLIHDTEYIHMTQLKATCIVSADSQLEGKACTQKGRIQAHLGHYQVPISDVSITCCFLPASHTDANDHESLPSSPAQAGLEVPLGCSSHKWRRSLTRVRVKGRISSWSKRLSTACSWHLALPGATENLEIAQSTLRLDSDDEIDETRPVTLAQIPTK